MYLNHFNLSEKPFELSPGPRFLWLGEKHSEALATLKYGILENKGFLLLTGDVGVGKTALIHRLLQEVDPSTVVANVPDPGLNALDFFNVLASEFGMAKKFKGKGEFVIEFKKFLKRTESEQKNVLLIIDEAQQLNEEILEQVRLLSNIETSDRKLINIFFVGQPEFTEMLMDSRNRAVRQRIIISFHVESLTETETEKYIRHRLEVAGAARKIFEEEAFHEIYEFSRGCPRLINIICDHALLAGYTYGLETVGPDVIKECQQDLRIPAGREAQRPSPRLEPAETVAPHSKPLYLMEQPRRSKLGKQLVLVGLICVVGVAVSYILLSSGIGLWSTPTAQTQPNGPQQLAATTAVDQKPGPDAKTDMKSAPDGSPASEPLENENLLALAEKEKGGIQPQGQQYDVADQTMTISSDEIVLNDQPESRITGQTQFPVKNDRENAASSPGGLGEPTTGPEDVPESQLKPSFGSAEASGNDQPRIETEMPTAGTKKEVDEKGETTRAEAPPSQTKVGAAPSASKPESGQSADVSPRIASASAAASAAKKPPVKTPAPAQTAAASPASPPTQNKEAVSEKGPSSQAVKQQSAKPPGKIAVFNSPPVPEAKPAAERLEDRLRSFLQNYCDTYAAKDLGRFADFFGPGAKENGKSFESLLPKYQKNFDSIETIRYRIELNQYAIDDQRGTVRIEGNFLLKWLPPDNKWRQNSGKIFMNLKDDGRSFLVQSLDYFGERPAN